jgi:regulator of protease activity HflC (stomatin/prohibitin superfamily)
MPFADEVRKVNITPSQLDINVPVGNQGAITRDNQTIGADMVVFYRFKESELINIAKNYGYDVLTSKIQKDVNESFKQVIGQYTIFDVAVKQEDIRQEMISGARLKLGDYPIVIEDVKVSNYDWSDEFDKQIATTMTIAQETKQQEQELKKVEITAQKKVKEAEANRQAEVLNAEAMKVKGEGIRDYNAAITANPRNMELEIKLKQLEIEKLRVERWNGQYVPVNHY